ncbi:acyl carrier protein [Nocardia otitidiscaviarum]|uniref:acyl carrier protein n=1 Tax=Nocardia otitidiscaviarum TaxID=1823 RepID=UPI0004A6F220|nr:phosphopantetheine-binding protein [Nocardia otitidiscaviarum]MBF6136339.1 acyl carrier protein [Nocardia otitidiscaviarum]MBF6484541.1 acyl carrier protein [Nocardia otitidiscaviarum]
MTSTQDSVADRVRAIVAEALWVAADDLEGGTPLVDYGLDSPTSIDLTMRLEDAFGVTIPDAVAARLDTVDRIVEHVRETIR